MAKKVEPVLAALSAQELNEERLLQLRNVTGVGTGYRFKNGKMTKEVTVQVLVDKKMPPESLGSADIVQEVLDGPGGTVGTDVLEVRFEAYQDQGRYRPVPAGVSIGQEATVSAGTLGGWACDNSDDTIVLLSNNHVISNLDTMPVLRRIVQPGRFDGGVLPGDVIGQLKRHSQVNTVPNVVGAAPVASVVDAAIGTIDVNFTYNLRQLNVPVIYEIQAAALGMAVQKRGRTTTFTNNGTITSINVTVNITYRNKTRLGRIQNSFIITSTDGNVFSGPGDSGSLVLNQAAGVLAGTFPVVGLLYGGGIQNGKPVTIANDINAVFGALNLETACVCIARALIRAIFDIFSWPGSSEISRNELGGIPTIREWGGRLGGRYMLMHKERQLRQFRDHLRKAGKFGAGMEELIRKETARVGQIIAEDEEAFGLLVEALRPFVVKPTIKDILDTRLDRKILKNLLAFSSRVGKSKEIRSKLVFVKEVAKTVEGMKLRDVLRSAELSAAGSKQR